MKTQLIVNPNAARGKMATRFPPIAAVLRTENFSCDVVFTEQRGHASDLARAALDAGYELIVSVGGDGTLNEVVNGMLDPNGKPRNPNAVLGVISSGTGSDFVRSANLPRDMLLAARHLVRATQTVPLDIGEMIFHSDGKETRRYFVNVAGMGFDAEVIERTERGGKRGGGTIPYYTALLATIGSYENKEVVVQLDDQTLQGRMNSVVICNGKYFGGGMMISPHATLDDGKFDVIILGDFGKLEVLLNTPRLYNGTILEHPKVSEYRASIVTVESRQRMLIQADGEFIGAGPATFRILPAALKLRI